MRWGNARSLLLFFFLLAGKAGGQSYFIPLDRTASHWFERQRALSDSSLHTSIRPYTHPERRFVPDTSWRSRLTFRKDNDPWRIWGSPLVDLGAGYSTGPNDPVWRWGAGAEVGMDNGRNLVFYGRFLGAASNDLFLDPFGIRDDVVPGSGLSRTGGSGGIYLDAEAYAGYSPSQHFTFHIGRGQHQFGNGYRSLLLSDNTAPYPYLRLETEVWKLKYINLYTWFRDKGAVDTPPSDLSSKFGTFHYLSWQATDYLQLGLFESVIWQGEDSLVTRGYEVNYLNPIIFYRPVEYAQGSADNSLMGLDLQLTLWKRYQFYGQLVLDEFLLEELRENRGWWGNKYGWQAGLQAFDLFGVTGLDIRGEVNSVRPYTYSHGSVLQSYGHYTEPLAHPYGANFREGLFVADLVRERWWFSLRTALARIGTDPYPSTNYGGNIYRSYIDRVSTYGHEIGQGVRWDMMTSILSISYLFVPSNNLRAGIGYGYRSMRSDNWSDADHFVALSLYAGLSRRSSLFGSALP